MAQHQAKVDEAIEQAKSLAKAMKTGKIAADEIVAANHMGSRLLTSRASFADPKHKRGVSLLLLTNSHVRLEGAKCCIDKKRS